MCGVCCFITPAYARTFCHTMLLRSAGARWDGGCPRRHRGGALRACLLPELLRASGATTIPNPTMPPERRTLFITPPCVAVVFQFTADL